MSLLPFGSVT